MSLDMCLYKRVKSSKKGELKEVCYWMDFTPVHNWFVNNIQSGVDNGGFYPLTKENLDSLIHTLKTVNDSKSEDVAKASFPIIAINSMFLCSGNYDEIYFEEVEIMLNQLTDVKNSFDFDKFELCYNYW